ncbi:MAG: hypothetical protein CMF59_10705 [Leptospiraceae bacterium]|nr:hypothetical protein [Leptospiraceae bacterium]
MLFIVILLANYIEGPESILQLWILESADSCATSFRPRILNCDIPPTGPEKEKRRLRDAFSQIGRET